MRLPFMVSCQKATELTEKELAGELKLIGRMQLSIHRLMCDACRRYGWQVKELDELLRKDSAHTDQSTAVIPETKELKKRIHNKLDDL